MDEAFRKQFEREVHEAFQKQGSKLRNTVRTINNVNGSTAVFQKVGAGTASTKSTHGMVPVMNLSHSNVDVTLQDFYAGDWVSNFDELKINISEREVVANAGAYALGRKADNLIINALDNVGSGQVIESRETGMTLNKVMDALNLLGDGDIPDDGERYAIVGWKQWVELLGIPEFVNAEYVKPHQYYQVNATQCKRWLGTFWMPHSGLPIDGSDIRSCFWYHRTAVGFASGSDVQSDITWHGDRASHFVNNLMAQGAVKIEDSGIVEIQCDETPSK